MSNKNDSLGDRMKRYEGVSRNFLTRRVPVVIRLDGKAFHTFTRGMKKPFDRILMNAMQETMKYLCKNVQGCVFGYTQSDEITLVLTDYATIKTDAWFGYNVQKMTSIAASMATLAFNACFIDNAEAAVQYYDTESSIQGALEFDYSVYESKFGSAMFDARAFSVPVDDVCNCLIWRQQDATRNSIEAVGQANFSHKELQGKSCNDIQEMLWSQCNLNWNDFPVDCKRGSCCYRQWKEVQMQDPRDSGKTITVSRREWVIDREPPIFTQDRDYVERWL
nr:tRNA(His) guanylyltransferase Thg1 family protein [Acutalibacter muris]